MKQEELAVALQGCQGSSSVSIWISGMPSPISTNIEKITIKQSLLVFENPSTQQRSTRHVIGLDYITMIQAHITTDAEV